MNLQPVTLHQLTSCATLSHVFATLSHPNVNIKCLILLHIYIVSLYEQSPSLLHEAASDAVCALLQVVADHENDDDAHNGVATHALHELRSLEDSLILSIKGLETAYHMAVAQEDIEK